MTMQKLLDINDLIGCHRFDAFLAAVDSHLDSTYNYFNN